MIIFYILMIDKVQNCKKIYEILYLLRVMSYNMRMNVGKLPSAGSLEWKRSRRSNYSRINRSPICDRSEIVPSFLMQCLMMELLLLIV